VLWVIAFKRRTAISEVDGLLYVFPVDLKYRTRHGKQEAKEGRSSFLKKRSKRLLCPRGAIPKDIKGLVSPGSPAGAAMSRWRPACRSGPIPPQHQAISLSDAI
jgi:hypothetical protein